MTNTSPHDDIARQPQASPATIIGASVVGGLVLGVSALLITVSMTRPIEQPIIAKANVPQSAPAGDVRVAYAAVAQKTAPTTSGAATPEPSAARDEAACDRQAWPYITPECRQRKIETSIGSGANRQVRVITTDGTAPTIISSPVPIIEPKTAKVSPKVDPVKTQPAQQAASAPAHQQAAAPSTTGTIAPAIAHVQPAATAAAQPAVTRAPHAAAVTPAPVYASATAEDEEQASTRSRSAERKARRDDERRARRSEARSGKMLVRTIEFPDGRRVTITRPIGKEGVSSAMAEIDRASERATASGYDSRARGHAERVSAESYGYVMED
jgi:hypothetical protein